MKYILIFILLFLSNISAQETPPNSDPKENQEKSKNWYLYLNGSGGVSNTPVEKGTYSGGKVGVEYRPNPYIGFGFGLAGGSSTLKSKSDPVGDLLLPIVLLGGSSNSTNNLLPLLLVLSSLNDTAVAIRYNLIFFDFTFHANKDRFIDPYFGIGITGGACTGQALCTVAGGEAKLGLQLNFESVFVFLQGQHQALTFTGKGESSGATANLTNDIGSLGIGFRF